MEDCPLDKSKLGKSNYHVMYNLSCFDKLFYTYGWFTNSFHNITTAFI